ncbi:MAG: molecular chaperone TorD family protein [Mucispirillum sp.]|nr:molecular chaperone TorD family protein [Mucispirillum sp.]
MSFNQELQEDLINSSILRSAFFNYFFRVFNNIADENFIGVSEKYLTYFNDLKDYVESNEYNNACQMFEEYINNEKNAVNIQDFLQRLNIEFTSLFLSGMGNIPASASSYLSSDGLLKGEEWEKVVKVYKMRDFQMPDSIKAPEDYISVEMLYMQKLSDLIGRLAEDGDINLLKATIDDQINFSSNHILVWIDMFADAVYSKSITLNSKLYASVAVIMKHYIKYDIELLKEFAEELNK